MGVFEDMFSRPGPVKKGCGVQALLTVLAVVAALGALGSWGDRVIFGQKPRKSGCVMMLLTPWRLWHG